MAGVFVGSDNRKKGVGEHRNGDPAGPRGVAADLVLIESCQPLPGLEGLFHTPPGAGDLDQGDQWGWLDGMAAMVGEFAGSSVAGESAVGACPASAR